MITLKYDPEIKYGKFKILNATNGGPWHKRHAPDQYRSNFCEYKAARIPYSRNHDSAMHPIYGGPHSHDITCIFPDFNADPYDPASYDFGCTDEAILICLEAGTETFFRLGQTIENQIKKHDTRVPPDYKKWAIICEHIIRHYNEGWADGYRLGIKYWEIWNEPDLDADDALDKRNWQGTKMQFFDLYEIAAKHLKYCFPELKIGGPASCGRLEWISDFLTEMKRRNVPIDFFSWHIYATEPSIILALSEKIKALLVESGYETAESILNEWNYVKGWDVHFKYSIMTIHGIKGATFTMACICAAQPSDIDMLMYYDTRPSAFCGAFDYYSYEPLKGYYPLYWYGMFYDMDYEIRCEKISDSNDPCDNVYTLCGVNKNGKKLAVIAYYSDRDDLASVDLHVDLQSFGTYEIYLLDKDHNGELIKTVNDLDITVSLHSVVLIKEI
ncbi:MAG: hypothetical protein IKJ75_00290 [Clostridia bacterium]|nr:hypothetical protein [Clostridia bacterium]